MAEYKGPLHKMAATTATDYWNDSCATGELTYAIENGAVGATTNPTIVLQVLRQELDRWSPLIHQWVGELPTATEEEIAWRLIEEMARAGARLLLPVFEREQGRKGRLSAQTNPLYFRDPARIVDHALRLAGLAPNMQVKIPVTSAGVTAIEEATAAGVNINATVCFTVPQSLAAAEAVERGLARRRLAGLPVAEMTPVCTIMVGRLEDWLAVIVARENLAVAPDRLCWAGVAAFKRAYALYRERGYATRLLAAAYRHHLHWSQLIGGDVVLTIPGGWQRQFNASGIPVVERIDEPVDPGTVAELLAHLPDFRRAYEPDGLTVAQFDSYGATVRTLRSFIASYRELLAVVRDFMLPDPDRRPGGAR